MQVDVEIPSIPMHLENKPPAVEDKVQDLKLRVALRVRPLLGHELERGCKEVVSTANATQVKIDARSGELKSFTYDYAFGTESTQDEVYNKVVLPLVDGCFDGYNATVLAYGQTVKKRTNTTLPPSQTH